MAHDLPIHKATTVQGAAQVALPKTTGAAARSSRLSPMGRRVIRQVLIQLFLLGVLALVLFPVLWIISMAVDPRGISRPTDLNLFPANATLDAFYRLLSEPFSNVLPIHFSDLLMNSLFVALGTALFAVTLGASAAYSFSRFKFIGRQGGMLAFIVLLMLPATGTLIPLYLLFNSVQISSVLAYAVPAYFGAALAASSFVVIYRVVLSYASHDADRSFNPGPLPVTIVTALVALVAVIVTFAVIYERSPAYQAAVNTPLRAAAGPLDAAQSDYNRRVQSVPRSQRQAQRAALAAEAAAEYVPLMTTINTEAQSTADLAAYLAAQYDARWADVELEDDFVLVTLANAQTALEQDGEEAALALLADATARADDEAARRLDTAQRAAQSVAEAEIALAQSEAALAEEQATFDEVDARVSYLRNQGLVQAVPYYLLAWVGVLAGAGLVWLVVYALRQVVEPRTLVHLLALALFMAVVIGLGTATLQGRIGPGTPQTLTLRLTLFGLSLAFASGQLPFAIWNLKGYFDTIPKDLEEAALIDGAGRISTFFRIMLPLALPAFVIVILFSFMGSWTEFILSWVFLTGSVQDYTLAMALVSMANGGNTAPPDMQKFAAMSILVSIPILAIFFGAQRWLVSGLTLGAVK
jgi:ABC-type maltose transport system permease subunit